MAKNNKKRKKINKLKLIFTLLVLFAILSGLVFAGFKIYSKIKPKESNKSKEIAILSDNIKNTKEKPKQDQTAEDKNEENNNGENTGSEAKPEEAKNDEEPKQEEKVDVIFTHSEIPYEVRLRMRGKSMPMEDSLIKFSDLSYLKLTFYGFDNKIHNGEMVVNKKIAPEVVDIFKELYEKKYPIEKMKLIDDYDGDDEASMQDNNTSAFCYRVIAGSDTLSNHAKGLAIDINPKQNPHVTAAAVMPKGSEMYANRDDIKKGMIRKYDLCYKAFTDIGWSWGGHWKNPDYQHFEKLL
ncbi:M15 family metallopeptidase [Clostridioides mangenotii]|uniref:M15 family metallopeptidase n=1 Tax=Metaclostridioides mangenotii TaxID=1540 RepID=UPI00214A43B4|nr:M15 family metallopeptidase [Clostridioides mangenotii]MCR1953475.1 M15 family metallopeptidase [Clostridioides mangenotii]